MEAAFLFVSVDEHQPGSSGAAFHSFVVFSLMVWQLTSLGLTVSILSSGSDLFFPVIGVSSEMVTPLLRLLSAFLSSGSVVLIILMVC